MKCLAKDADDRPQRAVEIVRLLDTVTSGAGHDAMPMILAGGRGMFGKALLLYATAFAVVAVVAKAAIVAVGLPDWVFPGALVVMALGLPVILFTAYVHRTTRKLMGATPTYTPGGTPSPGQGTMAQLALKASPHWSWRRAAIGGGLAVVGFVLLVGGYMMLRAMGIGPAGSLLAAGTMAQNEKILVADLPSPAADSTLGPVVTDAFRTALGQSASVMVVQPATVRDVLRRMQRPADTHVDFQLAREIATREGIKAVIDGSLLNVGGRYVLAMRLVSAQTGDELATFRETADNESEILPAVDRLAKQVRAKIGESLKNVQGAPPLEQVTTSSLEALKKYVQGVRVASVDGDFARGSALLKEAVALDTGFAMAYRKLAVEYSNRGLIEQANDYLDKAYNHRDRLSDAERYLLLGSYYMNGAHLDGSKATAAFEQLLELQPNNTAGLNNLGSMLIFRHQYARAESLLTRAIRVGPVAGVHYWNLTRAQVALGKIDSARATTEACYKSFPTNIDCQAMRSQLLFLRGHYDSIATLLTLAESRFTGVESRSQMKFARGWLARMHGKIADGLRLSSEGNALMDQAGDKSAPLDAGIAQAIDVAWFLGDTARALRILEDSLAHHPIQTLGRQSAKYVSLVIAFATAGRPDRARSVKAQWTEHIRLPASLRDSMYEREMQGEIDLASGHFADAQAAFRAADANDCPVCRAPMLAKSYDLEGKPDSAIAVFERYLSTPFLDRQSADMYFLPGVHKRLGELYEAKGDREKALRHYRIFIDLWKDADPQLQPKVQDARMRIAALTRGTDVGK
jgi:tetratricopeptide (TPR) repeat protein